MTYELFPVALLSPDPRNPKQHTPEQIDKIIASIEEAGWGRPILANRRTGYIIAGHGAWEAAKKLGMSQVPVIWTDLDPGKALILLLADNRLAELAENDPEKLANVFKEIKFDYPTLNIEATGYSLLEIDKFIPGGEVYEDDFEPGSMEEDLQEPPETKQGDLWLLGPHRLFCGDATGAASVEILMNKKRARLVVTDPPYNVDYSQAKNINPPKIHRPGDLIKNDAMSPLEFKKFIDATIHAIFSVSDGPYYIFMSCKEWPRIMAAFESAGGHWSSTIIWNKSNHVISRKDYHPKFEPILYGWKDPDPGTVPDYTPILYGWREGSQVQHLLERSKSDVWEFSKPSKNIEHPTMKPVELMGEAIKNSSDLGDIVLDLFAGSGSTLIACEQLGRICYSMELMPKYCDVIKTRWEALTGKQAVRIPKSGD